jgi:hypothetical protein
MDDEPRRLLAAEGALERTDTYDRFELVKWYLDTVEPDGSAAIAYWTSLKWLGVNNNWHDLSRYDLGKPPAEQSSGKDVPPPFVADGHIAFQSAPLALETMHEAATPGLSLTLFESSDGRVQWECLAPSARARFDRGGVTTAGAGYVERMTMTIPPWQLPIAELRWGRWMNDALTTSLVWIDWRGALPRRWVVFNGTLHDGAVVRDDGVDLDAGRLALGAPRTLHDRSVGKLLRGISGLARIAMHIPLAWDEHKFCCRAAFTGANGESTSGWSIHELVRMP